MTGSGITSRTWPRKNFGERDGWAMASWGAPSGAAVSSTAFHGESDVILRLVELEAKGRS